MVCRQVKNTFGFQPYKWQAAVILDILKGVNIIVHVGTSSGKSLPFQAILTIKIGAIVLLISSTMALIEDQINDSLILLLSRLVCNDVLVSHNAKKKDQHYCTNL